jgi:hypothetical protein
MSTRRGSTPRQTDWLTVSRNLILALTLTEQALQMTGVEAGSNTSTVILRVVGSDETGSLKTETVKYGREIQGTRTWERLRWRGAAAERALHKNKTVTVQE